MKQFYTILMCGVMGLFLLSGCDSSDKAALEAAKENQLVQKQARDAQMARWRDRIYEQGLEKKEHYQYCDHYKNIGYNFNASDEIDKYCLVFDSEEMEKKRKKENAEKLKKAQESMWPGLKKSTPEKK